MTRKLVVVTSLVVFASLGVVRTPGPMTEADLSVGGMQWIPDTADARRVLGTPSSMKAYTTRIDDEDLQLTDWVYPGLRLIFSHDGKLRWARITDRSWVTHRVSVLAILSPE
ncbi:MAG TPA: hypothetical protein VEV39_12130 [Gemmatimonadales bacterium]|nr:hypothetical protein [Gemmatimonadales bacterium]